MVGFNWAVVFLLFSRIIICTIAQRELQNAVRGEFVVVDVDLLGLVGRVSILG